MLLMTRPSGARMICRLRPSTGRISGSDRPHRQGSMCIELISPIRVGVQVQDPPMHRALPGYGSDLIGGIDVERLDPKGLPGEGTAARR